jgi:hypothetical protein
VPYVSKVLSSVGALVYTVVQSLRVPLGRRGKKSLHSRKTLKKKTTKDGTSFPHGNDRPSEEREEARRETLMRLYERLGHTPLN